VENFLGGHKRVVKYPVVLQKWTESERGWGQRPDGWSLHLNNTEREKYIREYWADQSDGPAPDEYSFPNNEGGKIIDVCEATYELLKNKKSMRGFGDNGLNKLIGG
jgi:hypothetical protein